MLKRTIPLVATLALTASGALIAGSPGQASGAAAAATTTPTKYAMQAFGYGSRVRGGDVPAGSDRSAFAAIGCTNLAGLSRTNTKAHVDLGQGLRLSGVSTHVWTSKSGGAVSSWANHSIARATLGASGPGQITIKGISSTAHAWHGAAGFRAKTTTDISRIFLNEAGVQVDLGVPTAGNPIVIPGVARIALGSSTRSHGAHSASAAVDALRLRIDATNTNAYLAHSYSTIHGGVSTSVFKGSAYDTKANAFQGHVTSGPTPLIVMPCQGTNGQVVRRSIAHAHIGGAIQASTLKVSQSASVRKGVADAYERASVARIRLTSNLVIKAVVAKAHVVRSSKGYLKEAKGTSTGTIVFKGRVVRIPASGVLRLPGVAKIESNLVQRSPRGIGVTALKVTLLDGSLAVVNIAHAQVSVAPSGL